MLLPFLCSSILTCCFQVEAVLFGDGGIVNYPETVVYRDDAIIPVAVIMYGKFN
jgi:hypothetical protein